MGANETETAAPATLSPASTPTPTPVTSNNKDVFYWAAVEFPFPLDSSSASPSSASPSPSSATAVTTIELENAIRMLGGTEAITKTCNKKSTAPLELRLDPDDPFCHPIKAENKTSSLPTTGASLRFLVRITTVTTTKKGSPSSTSDANARSNSVPPTATMTESTTVATTGTKGKSRRGNTEDSSDANSKATTETDMDRTQSKKRKFELIGKIETTSRFRELADFQYHPPPNALWNEVADSLFQFNIPQLSRIKLSRFELDTNTYLLPPPLFSLSTQPAHYGFRQNPYVIEVMVPDLEEGTLKKQLVNRDQPKVPILAGVDYFVDEVPSGPPDHIQERASTFPEDVMEELKTLFEKRPIWSRIGIENNLTAQFIGFKIRELLSYFAYKFVKGPWRSLWIKYGYDPRQDPSASKYQFVAFRRNVPTQQRSTIGNKDGANASPKESDTTITTTTTAGAVPTTTGTVPTTSHILDANTSPNQVVFAGYQVCDVLLPSFVVLANNPNNLRKECDVNSGWFRTDVIEEFRRILKQEVGRICGNSGELADNEPEEEIELDKVSKTSSMEQTMNETVDKMLSEVEKLAKAASTPQAVTLFSEYEDKINQLFGVDEEDASEFGVLEDDSDKEED